MSSVRSAALLAGALAVSVYANSLVNGFAYDDARVILDNTELHSFETLPGAVFKPYWHGKEGEISLGLWRPTTTLLFGLEYAVAGDKPALYHAANVVGHGLVTLLVVLVLAELVAVPMAFAAGLLFAVHPVHVEAVSNVVGGAEGVATGFFLRRQIPGGDGFVDWNDMIAARDTLEAAGVEVLEHDGPTEIFPSVWLTGPIGRTHAEQPVGAARMFVDGEWIPTFIGLTKWN